MALSRPLVLSLFGGGKFDAYSVDMTARVLFFYSIGLCAYGATKIIQSCFFALKDTVTPAKISFLALILNIVLNALLMFPMKLAGLALATSISGIIAFLILFYIITHKLVLFNARSVIFPFMRIAAASVCMGIACYFSSRYIFIPGHGVSGKFFSLVGILCVAAAAYIFFCLVFRVKEMQDAWAWLRRRKNPDG